MSDEIKCPYCGNKDFILPTAAYNARHHDTAYLFATTCCNRPMEVSRVIVFQFKPVETKETEDDWGNPFARLN